VKATLTELHRHTRRVIRPVIDGGQKVILTEHGQDIVELSKVLIPDRKRALEILRRMRRHGLVIPERVK